MPRKVSEKRPLAGRVTIVTGASSGIGEAVAEACAAAGSQVVLVARRAERLSALAERIAAAGEEALVAPADVRDPGALSLVAEAAVARYGRIDALVAGAGVGHSEPLVTAADERLREVVAVNLLGVMRSVCAVLPAMTAQGSGHVIAVASVAAGCVMPLAAPYGATKAGVVAFCEGLRREVRPFGIQVTALLPGYIATPMTAGLPFPMPPASLVGRVVVNLLLKPRRTVVVPGWYRLALLANRVAPGLVDRLIERLLSRR